ncbi:10642_t:CDS:10 [Acaulospora morrowiae]|uniref:10642_t:CDS:1 n=1 Tax=Acaulospora morrowiae TaxID=94023 RepID=A0A9N9G013_9GLOM|nr:10642_t:CDS:10 [Acaulospora morrowiae]
MSDDEYEPDSDEGFDDEFFDASEDSFDLEDSFAARTYTPPIEEAEDRVEEVQQEEESIIEVQPEKTPPEEIPLVTVLEEEMNQVQNEVIQEEFEEMVQPQKVSEEEQKEYRRNVILQAIHVLKSDTRTEQAYNNFIETVGMYPELLPKRLSPTGEWLTHTWNELEFLMYHSKSYMRETMQPLSIDKDFSFKACKSLAPRRLHFDTFERVDHVEALVRRQLGGANIVADSAPNVLYKSFSALITLDGCHSLPSYNILFDPSGQRIIIGNEDNKVKIWSSNDGILLRTFNCTYGGIVDMAINKENDILAVACGDKNVCLFDLVNYKKITKFRLDSVPTSIQFSSTPLAENCYILATCKTSNFYLVRYDRANEKVPLNIENAQVTRPDAVLYKTRSYFVTSSFNRTGTRFAIGGNDGLIRVFSTIKDKTFIKGLQQQDNYMSDYSKLKADEKTRIQEAIEKFDLVKYIEEHLAAIPEYQPAYIDEDGNKGRETVNQNSPQLRCVRRGQRRSNLEEQIVTESQGPCLSDGSQSVKNENDVEIMSSTSSKRVEPPQSVKSCMSDIDFSDVSVLKSMEIDLKDTRDGLDNADIEDNLSDIVRTIRANDRMVVDSDYEGHLEVSGGDDELLDQDIEELPNPIDLNDVLKDDDIVNDASMADHDVTSYHDVITPGHKTNIKNDTASEHNEIEMTNRERIGEYADMFSDHKSDITLENRDEPEDVFEEKKSKVDSEKNKSKDPVPGIIEKLIRQLYFTPVLLSDLIGHTKKVHSLEFAHFSNQLISGSDDGKLLLWDYDKELKDWGSKELIAGVPITTIRWSCNDQYIVSGHNNGDINVFDSATGQRVRHYAQAHSKIFYVLDVNPRDPKIFMSAGYDDRIVVWNVDQREELKCNEPHHRNDGGNETFEFYDGKWREDGVMFAVTDNVGKCYLIGLKKELYTHQIQRAKFGQKFSTEDLYSEIVEISSNSNPGVMLYNDGWVHAECPIQLEVISSQGTPYAYQHSVEFIKSISGPMSEKDINFMNRGRLEMIIEEARRLVEDPFELKPLNQKMDLKEIQKHRRKVILSEDELDDIDPMTIEIPIIPIPDDDEQRDQNYDPELSESETSEDSEVEERFSKDDSIFGDIEHEVIDNDNDSDYVPNKRAKTSRGRSNIGAKGGGRGKAKARGEISLNETDHEQFVFPDTENDEPIPAKSNNAKSRKRRRNDDDEYIEDIGGPSATTTTTNSRPLRRVRARINYNESDSFLSDDYDASEYHHTTHSKISTYEISGNDQARRNSRSPSLHRNDGNISDHTSGTKQIPENFGSRSIENPINGVRIDTLNNRESVETEEHKEADRRPDWIKAPGDYIVYFKRGHQAFNGYVSEHYQNCALLNIIMQNVASFPYYHKFDLSSIAFFQIDVVTWYVNDENKEANREKYQEKVEMVEAKTSNILSPVNDYPELILDSSGNKQEVSMFAEIICRIVHPTWTESEFPLSPERNFRRPRSKYIIPYVDLNGLREFILPYEKFAEGMNRNRNLDVGDKVDVYYQDGFYPGTILSKNNSSLWSDSVPSFTVKWDDSDEHDDFYPWELKIQGSENLITGSMSDEVRTKLLGIIDELLDDPMFDCFCMHVNFHMFPQYLNVIPHPMSLRMIHQRLLKKFYRHQYGVQHDLELIVKNAKKFNEPDSFVPAAASRLSSLYRKKYEKRGLEAYPA